MPIVTSLKAQKKNNRVNVYLDNEFGFGIDLDNLVILKIKIGNEYSDTQIKELVQKAEFQKTLEKIIRFCSMRPRAKSEIEIWFKKKQVHPSLWEGIESRLIYYDLLNDQKFTRWWVDQRTRQNKSVRYIKSELKMKGISRDLVDEYLSDSKTDDVRSAKELLLKKISKWDKFDPQTKKQKIAQFLAQRGFDWNVIEQVMPKMVK